MAEQKKAKPKRRVRKVETVRQKAAKTDKAVPKKRRARHIIGSATKPLKAAHRTGQKEYFLPLPDNRFGRFLNKRRRIIPSYFRNSYQELRQVTWPNRRQTVQLTLAVFAFAIAFGIMITVLDYGLDKLFKNVLIK